jgi:hypothetical protein
MKTIIVATSARVSCAGLSLFDFSGPGDIASLQNFLAFAQERVEITEIAAFHAWLDGKNWMANKFAFKSMRNPHS